MADDYYHTFYYANMSSNMRAAQEAIRIYLLNPTNIDTVLLSTVDSNTNVVVYQQDYSTYCDTTWHSYANPLVGATGMAKCVSLAGGSRCLKHELRYDTSYESTVSQDYREGLACNETGHSLGLRHRDVELSCMRSKSNLYDYSPEHDIPHLNSNYVRF